MKLALIIVAIALYGFLVLLGLVVSFAAAGEKTPAWKILFWPFLIAWSYITRD